MDRSHTGCRSSGPRFIGVAVALYVILDGFDLGLGILFPVGRGRRTPRPDDELGRAVLGRQRDLAGARRRRTARRLPAGLRGDHAGALPADHRHAAGARLPRRRLRVPLGAKPSHEFWDLAFAGGSIVATFVQGVVLGGFLQGITSRTAHFAGGTFDWLAPFPLFCGLGARRRLRAARRDVADL